MIAFNSMQSIKILIYIRKKDMFVCLFVFYLWLSLSFSSLVAAVIRKLLMRPVCGERFIKVQLKVRNDPFLSPSRCLSHSLT